MRAHVSLLVFAAMLHGCASSSIAIVDTAKQVLGRQAIDVDKVKLDPRYRYLLVNSPAGVAGLTLGFMEPDAHGPIEVWYSLDAEVMRLQNGRLLSVSGLRPEWRTAHIPELPAWSTLAAARPVHWQRVRDVMPGYRYGIRDDLELTRVPPPRTSRLRGLDPKQLVWFEERNVRSTEEPLPPAHYAVRGDTVVYGEQCVSREACFTWQRWPAGS